MALSFPKPIRLGGRFQCVARCGASGFVGVRNLPCGVPLALVALGELGAPFGDHGFGACARDACVRGGDLLAQRNVDGSPLCVCRGVFELRCV